MSARLRPTSGPRPMPRGRTPLHVDRLAYDFVTLDAEHGDSDRTRCRLPPPRPGADGHLLPAARRTRRLPSSRAHHDPRHRRRLRSPHGQTPRVHRQRLILSTKSVDDVGHATGAGPGPLAMHRAVSRGHVLHRGSAYRVRRCRVARFLARILRRTGRAAGQGRHRRGGGDVLRIPSRLRRAGDPCGLGHRRIRPTQSRRARSEPSARCVASSTWRLRESRAPARLVLQATDGCDPFARPLFAANHDLEWPTEPHLALWHGCTLLREHRGDGHIASLYAADVDPCEAHVLRLAVTGVDRATIAPFRGWDDDDWAAATERLDRTGLARRRRSRHCGRHRRAHRDRSRHRSHGRRADACARRRRARRALGIMRPYAALLASTGTIPFPNPIGVPARDRPTDLIVAGANMRNFCVNVDFSRAANSPLLAYAPATGPAMPDPVSGDPPVTGAGGSTTAAPPLPEN